MAKLSNPAPGPGRTPGPRPLPTPEPSPAAASPAYFPRPHASRTVALVGLAWFALSLALLGNGLYQALVLAPTDADQGNVFRIIFWHVPSSMLGLVFPYINFGASVAFLALRRRNPLAALIADAVAVSAAEVALVFITICLGTGMLWGRATWGIWWTWDARLTSLLLLWLLYVAYLMTRRMSVTGQTSTLGAVLAIFAAVDVPIVYMSIQWWRTQHPAPIFGAAAKEGMDKSMLPMFGWNVLAWCVWGLFLLAVRVALERRRQHAEIEATLSSLDASLTHEDRGFASGTSTGEVGNAL